MSPARRSEQDRQTAAMLRLESVLWDAGRERVAGVDEAGLGPLAGPVVAAAVIFPPRPELLPVRDSKQLKPAVREDLEPRIRSVALSVGVGVVEVVELDRMGVYQAGHEALRRAVEALDPGPDHLLVDARTIPDAPCPQSAFAKADSFVFSVAAASIVAKVYRDREMHALAERYPGYGLERHMGYGTAEHKAALERLGPCPAHRCSFAPIRDLYDSGRFESPESV